MSRLHALTPIALLAALAIAGPALGQSSGTAPSVALPEMPSQTSEEMAKRWAQGKRFNITFRSDWGAFADDGPDRIDFTPTRVRGQSGKWSRVFKDVLIWGDPWVSVASGTTCKLVDLRRKSTRVPCNTLDERIRENTRSSRVEFWGVFDGDEGFTATRMNVML